MKARKEVTIAVIIGLALAFLVTGGVLRAQKALQKLQSKLPNVTSTNKSGNSSESSTHTLTLALDTPDNSVVDTATIAVTGKTLPSTYIAILGEKGEHLIVPNELGVFTQEVVLVKGANTIRVTVYQEDGTKVEKSLSVVYTTVQL